jgi:hypothetical protein
MNKNPPKNKLLYYIMTEDPWAKIFWRIWFWWGIRQARKRKLENEARIAEMRKSENEKNSS